MQCACGLAPILQYTTCYPSCNAHVAWPALQYTTCYPSCNAHAHVAWPALQYFSTLSHKRHDFRKKEKKVTEHKSCVLTFSTTFVRNIFHLRRNEWDMIENVYRSSCKVPSCPVLIKFEFSRQIFFEKIHKNQISWKSVQWEPSCSMRTDGRTDGQTDR
jgi:hypothetical protein